MIFGSEEGMKRDATLPQEHILNYYLKHTRHP